MAYTSFSGSRSGLYAAIGAAAIMLLAVVSVQAQELFTLAGAGSCSTDGMKIGSEVEIGYQRLGLSFNLPALHQSILIPRSSTLDLALRKADLWCGAVDVVAAFPSCLSVGLKGQINAPNNASVYESQDYVEGGAQGVHWSARKLQWYTIDGRLMYQVKPSLAAVGGVRFERLSFDLSDPVNDQGEHLSLDDTGSLPPFTYQRHWLYTSNLTSKVWIPYVGVNFIGNGYRASLIGSPCASVNLHIPAEYFTDLALLFGGIPLSGLITDETWEYRVTKPAVFLEANLSCDFAVSQTANLSVWGKASWLGLRGKGTWHYLYNGQVPPDPPASGDEQSETNTATFSRYLLGGGISAVVAF